MTKAVHKAKPSPPLRWLVLVHQMPTKPAYHRVKIWRRLQETGAISLKSSVYALPFTPQAQEAFAAILSEIEQHGGDGLVCAADLVAGLRDDQLRQIFNEARDKDYRAIAMELRQLSQAWKKARKPKADPVQALARISSRLSDLAKVDFFGASARGPAEALLAGLEHSTILKADGAQTSSPIGPAAMVGKTWVTRQDIHVDRIACAWLIKRFIDPKGILKFVPGKQYAPQKGEYRYDMQGGEFTHEGDNCSFEVLLERALIKDVALKTIGQIVHDIDLKDGKFGHPETSGIAMVLSGICRTQGSDDVRLSRGKELFDGLYAQLRHTKRSQP